MPLGSNDQPIASLSGVSIDRLDSVVVPGTSAPVALDRVVWPYWSAVVYLTHWGALAVALWLFPFADLGRELAVSGRVSPLRLHGLWVIGVFGLLAGSLYGDMPLIYLLMPLGAIAADVGHEIVQFLVGEPGGAVVADIYGAEDLVEVIDLMLVGPIGRLTACPLK